MCIRDRQNTESCSISSVCSGINFRAIFHVELSVSCCCSAYSLCRGDRSIDHLLNSAYKSYKSKIRVFRLEKEFLFGNCCRDRSYSFHHYHSRLQIFCNYRGCKRGKHEINWQKPFVG